jgi:hypothetical protein
MTSINTSTNVDVQNKKPHYFRNAALGTTAGALIGGGVGYYGTKLVKDNLPSDKFIHSITKDYFIGQTNNNSILKDAELDILLDKIKDLTKNENLNSEELKTFLEKNKKFFKKELEKFNNGQADELTARFKNIIEKYNRNSNYIKDQLTSVLDTSKKKFNYNNLSPKIKELIEVGEFGLRSSNAMKIGGIAAIGLGALALIATKIKANQDKQ